MSAPVTVTTGCSVAIGARFVPFSVRLTVAPLAALVGVIDVSVGCGGGLIVN